MIRAGDQSPRQEPDSTPQPGSWSTVGTPSTETDGLDYSAQPWTEKPRDQFLGAPIIVRIVPPIG